jgi:hypothetical protein
MSTMSERLSSPKNVRRIFWVAAFIFVAGVVAVTITYFGDSPQEIEQTQPSNGASAAPTDGAGKPVPVSGEARKVAGEFILWAVDTGRSEQNLAKAWDIIHPTLKEECGCTKQEWMSGNIPIQPYPIAELDTASFAVDESFEKRVVLQVALLPKDGSGVESQIFYIGLQKVGTGAGRWLVDYWAPKAIIEVPVVPE